MEKITTTTHKALLTALRSRMKAVPARSPKALVTLTLTGTGLGLDGLILPAEVPAAAVGTSCTLNGFLLLELLRKKHNGILLSLHVTDEGRLCLELGTFRVDLTLTALTLPAARPAVSPETVEQVAKPAPARRKRPTKRFANTSQAPAYTAPISPALFAQKLAV